MAALDIAPNNDGKPTELWMLSHLYAGIEAVHVHMQDET